MPLVEAVSAGSPVWTDLTTTDMARARDFYGALLGWTFDESSPEAYGGYTNARKNGRLIAGVSPHHPEYGTTPNVWSLYLKSDDLEATAKAVTSAGGQVLVPPMHVAPFGHMAVFMDVAQGVVGGWQPQTHHGFGLAAEQGAPCWHELRTRDFAGAKAFFEKAFGWKTAMMSDTDEFRYATLGQGDDARAGLMDGSGFLPEGVPSHWVTYWGVVDTDAACDQVKRLGGAVQLEPVDSPYGRMASVADPMGALFNLISV